MFHKATVTLVAALPLLCLGQAPPASGEHHGPQPIYKVTIVSRTTKAISYNRDIPTKIDFTGTALMASARGHANVENRKGSTVIEAKFDHVEPPTRFGAQFLTYVLWALSPDGRAQNLGELVLNGSDKGKLTVSTNMQTFALIVTAEPHFSVTMPSDVVIMENAMRPDTVGKAQEVNATFELLPRKEFTYDTSAASQVAASGGKQLSMGEYEAVTALYQAQNAIQIAESQGADPAALAHAREVLEQARKLPKNANKEIVPLAREATQLAEDARIVANRRNAQPRSAVEPRPGPVSQPEAAPAPAQTAAEVNPPPPAGRTDPETVRAARMTTAPQTAPAAQIQTPPPAAPPQTAPETPPPARTNPRETRMNLTASLSRIMNTIDTPRGVMVTIPESSIGSAQLSDRLARLGAALRSYPGVQVWVEGYIDQAGQDANSVAQGYADSIRNALIRAGVPGDAIRARALGDARPVASNSTASGREQNRRVEIVVTGAAIGTAPAWDRSYSVAPSR